MLPVESFKKCSRCLGTGVDTYRIDDGEPVSSPCSPCGGSGKIPAGWVDIESLMDKCNELKTKINQMQADISYIKAKVG